MIVIIAGSRHLSDPELIDRAVVESGWAITQLVHGGAPGIDSLAGEWAAKRGIPVRVMPAKWEKYGKAAGPIRNTVMVNTGAEALIAIRATGPSPGTDDVVRKALEHNLRVHVHSVKETR